VLWVDSIAANRVVNFSCASSTRATPGPPRQLRQPLHGTFFRFGTSGCESTPSSLHVALGEGVEWVSPNAGIVTPSTTGSEPRICEPGRVDEELLYELRPVRALLFDLGGVVIDLDIGRAFQIWACRAGCDPTVIAERFSLDDSYEQHERGEIPASRYFAALRRSLGIDLSDDEFIEGWNDVYLGPVPGMAEVLSVAQRHLPLFAFTNSNPTHKSAWERLYADELRPFQMIYVSSDLGARKPETEAFRLVAKRMGFEPGEVLFFDDGPENVEGARTAGMQGVEVRSIRDVRWALSRIGLEFDT
jgi:HAD superfamily hydrolase (TIGR01509 family)